MAPTPSTPYCLDDASVAFILGPVSINVASCNLDLIPSVSRAYGCRVDLEHKRVTVFVAVSRARALLQDLRSGRRIAITVSRPTTHQTMQLKGVDAEVTPLKPGDRALIHAHGEAFRHEICAIGFPEPFARAMALPAAEDALGVTFTPVEAFIQSPGTGAGRRLESDS